MPDGMFGRSSPVSGSGRGRAIPQKRPSPAPGPRPRSAGCSRRLAPQKLHGQSGDKERSHRQGSLVDIKGRMMMGEFPAVAGAKKEERSRHLLKIIGKILSA